MSTFLPMLPCRAPDGRSSHHIPTLSERGGSGHTPCSPSASPLLRPHELADFPLFPISGEQCPHRLRPNSDIYGESPTLYFLSQKPLKMSYCSDLFPFISDGRVSAYLRHRPPLTPGCRGWLHRDPLRFDLHAKKHPQASCSSQCTKSCTSSTPSGPPRRPLSSHRIGTASPMPRRTGERRCLPPCQA
jgi:hypothetical protein